MAERRIRYGFYQLPVRCTFESETKPKRRPGWVVFVFELDTEELITKGEKDTEARDGWLALDFVKNKIGAHLPAELREQLEEISGDEIMEIPLLAGDDSGFLIRVSPKQIDVAETFRANQEHVKHGDIEERQCAELMRAFPETAVNMAEAAMDAVDRLIFKSKIATSYNEADAAIANAQERLREAKESISDAASYTEMHKLHDFMIYY